MSHVTAFPIKGRLHSLCSNSEPTEYVTVTSFRQNFGLVGMHPHPVNTGLLAEIMAFRAAEVIIGAEGGVEGGDQVEECLAAALVRERPFCLITALALAQPKSWGMGCRVG